MCALPIFCEVIADAACANSDSRIDSSILATSSSAQISRMSSNRSTATNAAATSPSEQPSSSTSSKGWTTPMRLTMRSEEHTSELQSLMRTSYAVFCLKNKNLKYKMNADNKKKNESHK